MCLQRSLTGRCHRFGLVCRPVLWTLGFGLARVDAHVVRFATYAEMPELTGDTLGRVLAKTKPQPHVFKSQAACFFAPASGCIFFWRAMKPGWPTRMTGRLAQRRIAHASSKTRAVRRISQSGCGFAAHVAGRSPATSSSMAPGSSPRRQSADPCSKTIQHRI